MTEPSTSGTWRLESLTCQSFKAFKKLDLKLNSRNLLLYGKNGSGKSSIYEAIKCFVDSSTYDNDTREAVLDSNKHLHHAEPIHISASLRNNTNDQLTYTIKASNASDSDSTNLDEIHALISKGRLASDFITYRVLYDFYTHRENDYVNIWPIFYKEILPFCTSINDPDLYEKVIELYSLDIKENIKKNENIIASRSQSTYDDEESYDNIDVSDSDDEQNPTEMVKQEFFTGINSALQLVIVEIQEAANDFYKTYFQDKRNIELTLGMGEFDFDSRYQLIEPRLILTIKLDGKENLNPLTYLNEATLTQLALSIRLGASKMMLNHESFSTKTAGLKLLVIDDLLISLDMSNRMKVIEILLGPEFAEFQKIIMTHDREFFKEIQRRIYNQHTQWSINEVDHTTKNGINPSKTVLEKAEDFIYGYIDDDSNNSKDLDAAGVNMRKAAEELVDKYKAHIDKIEAKIKNHNTQIENQSGLAKEIQSVIQRTMNAIHMKLYTEYLMFITKEELRLVIPDHVNDIDDSQKVRIQELRTNLYRYISTTPWRLVRNIYVIQQLDYSRNRILNAAAHDNSAPQYESDFKETLELLKSFTKIVNEPDITAPLMRFEQTHIEPIDPATRTVPTAGTPTSSSSQDTIPQTTANTGGKERTSSPTTPPVTPTQLANQVQILAPEDNPRNKSQGAPSDAPQSNASVKNVEHVSTNQNQSPNIGQHKQSNEDTVTLHSHTFAGHNVMRTYNDYDINKLPLRKFERKKFPIMNHNYLINLITTSQYYHESIHYSIPNLVSYFANKMDSHSEVIAIQICILIDMSNLCIVRDLDDRKYNSYRAFYRNQNSSALDKLLIMFQNYGLPLRILHQQNILEAINNIRDLSTFETAQIRNIGCYLNDWRLLEFITYVCGKTTE